MSILAAPERESWIQNHFLTKQALDLDHHGSHRGAEADGSRRQELALLRGLVRATVACQRVTPANV